VFERARLGDRINKGWCGQDVLELRTGLLNPLSTGRNCSVIVICGVHAAGTGETLDFPHEWMEATGRHHSV
jgi:hypothetical protein